jgi:5-dehydro-4-deoxyglucarate dehydratase
MAEDRAQMVMTPDALGAALHGPIAFPVTPFKPDSSVDLDGLRKNVEAMLAHPPAALVAAGGTGEIYSLTPEEHEAIVRTAVDATAGRIPVIAGAAFGAQMGARLARQAARAGASGILAFPPYYPHADEEGLFEYYRVVGAATPLGMLVYSRDWVHPGPAFVERLTTIPTLVAWKEGQGDIRRLQAIMLRVGDRLRWIGGAGDDLVPAYYALGIRAYTSSVANIAPRLAWQLHEAASNGEAPLLRQLMDDFITPLYALRSRRRGYEVTVMKALMDRLGLAGGPVRPPLPPLAPEDVAAVDAIIEPWASLLKTHPTPAA